MAGLGGAASCVRPGQPRPHGGDYESGAGLMLTNAMRDIMAGDFIAGLMRVAEAVLIGAGIAVGVMGTSVLFPVIIGKKQRSGRFSDLPVCGGRCGGFRHRV